MPDLAWLIGEASTLGLDYRYYTQHEAAFYEPRYREAADELRFRTRDRELSTLYANRLGLRYQHEVELGGGASVLTVAARASVTPFNYLAFVGLSKVECARRHVSAQPRLAMSAPLHPL